MSFEFHGFLRLKLHVSIPFFCLEHGNALGAPSLTFNLNLHNRSSRTKICGYCICLLDQCARSLKYVFVARYSSLSGPRLARLACGNKILQFIKCQRCCLLRPCLPSFQGIYMYTGCHSTICSSDYDTNGVDSHYMLS